MNATKHDGKSIRDGIETITALLHDKEEHKSAAWLYNIRNIGNALDSVLAERDEAVRALRECVEQFVSIQNDGIKDASSLNRMRAVRDNCRAILAKSEAR